MLKFAPTPLMVYIVVGFCVVGSLVDGGAQCPDVTKETICKFRTRLVAMCTSTSHSEQPIPFISFIKVSDYCARPL